jgi:hypothetical protein
MQIHSLTHINVVVVDEVVIDDVISEIDDVELDGEVNKGR